MNLRTPGDEVSTSLVLGTGTIIGIPILRAPAVCLPRFPQSSVKAWSQWETSLPTFRGAFSAASDLRLWASQALGDGQGAWVAFTPVEAHHAPVVFSTSHQHHLFSSPLLHTLRPYFSSSTSRTNSRTPLSPSAHTFPRCPSAQTRRHRLLPHLQTHHHPPYSTVIPTTMSGENENGTPGGERAEAPANTEHLNIKVTDNNNEVFFKIKRTTKLEKLMGAFCERQGKALSSVRFLFDGTRVQPTDTPDALEMQDGDTLEVHQEQVGGCSL
ncbi:hypothetical protein LCI18_009067 [Fusarium solani-melongenae]|uniref:Uncharacterized protein n=1 Tax=Fusarium solani subsp. cucurbitae TaxID=2747967 RepID=A0ACD3ZA97_FUSSC|nr:hypothetical protein LCI18_009067 [Fusarium solani-melongenae]